MEVREKLEGLHKKTVFLLSLIDGAKWVAED
jgi:hypothetical protein